MDQLDSELLRSFIVVADAGSVTEGADRLHRSQSAVSLQLKRLEAVLGRRIFDRHGRGVELTDAGRRLLPVARDVAARLDAALREIASDGLRGKLRIGIPDDHGRARLARIIGAFAQSHPLVELDVTCALSARFPEDLAKNRLDLAVYEVEAPSPDEDVLFEDPTFWASSVYRDLTRKRPTPVALFDHACWWRDAAITSLKSRGKPYRVVYSSQSVSGVIAAVEAGIAIGLLGRSSLHSGLSVVNETLGFEGTPSSKLVMASSERQCSGPIDAMKTAIRAAFLASASESGRSTKRGE